MALKTQLNKEIRHKLIVFKQMAVVKKELNQNKVKSLEFLYN